MKKVLVLMLALLGIPVLTSAQINPTGTITTAGADCSTSTNCVGWSAFELPGFGVYLNVGTAATLFFEVSQDATAITNGTWVALGDSAGATSATADGAHYFTNTGFLWYRVRASAITGSTTVSQARGYSSAVGSAGSIGDVSTNVEYNATPPTLADGGTDSPQADVNGRLLVNPFPVTPAGSQYIPVRITADGSTFATFGEDYLHDAALTPASTGGPVLLGRASAASPTAVTADNDAVLAWFLRNGAQVTATIDPCSSVAKTFFKWDITTGATTELLLLDGTGMALAGSGNYWYICSIEAVNGGTANNVNLVDDNTDGCGSVTASLVSSGVAAGDGYNLAANGGLTHGAGTSTIMRSTQTNATLCWVTSAASEFHGVITAVAAP